MLRKVLSFLWLIALIFQVGCRSTLKRDQPVRIGVDPHWSLSNFGLEISYVNGFTEDLLMEIASDQDMQWKRVYANPDFLFDGLEEGAYEAVLTSLPPYPYNLAKYDFSKNFLVLGPSLVVPLWAKETKLSEFKGKRVGMIGDNFLLPRDSETAYFHFSSIPELLNALVAGEIEGALVPSWKAQDYIADFYRDQLKLVSGPLTDEGLHLLALKGQQRGLVQAFDASLDHFKTTKELEKLLRKWNIK